MTRCRFFLLLAVAVASGPLWATDKACQDTLPESPRWFDRAQGYFSAKACGPAIWFDRFFGDQREEEVASALVRIIPQAQYTDLDYDEYRVRFKASVNLPNLSDRLSLVFDDNVESDSELLPGETAHELPEQNVPKQASAAMRYLVKFKNTSRADFDLGLRSQARVFARARYVKHWLPEHWLQLRYTQAFIFQDGPGWSEYSLLEAEHPMNNGRLFRVSTQLGLSQEFDGLLVREGVQLMRQVNKDRAISYNAFGVFEEEPEWRDQSYSVSVRYRQRLFRPWFFVEVEPFMDWARDHEFRSNPGIVLRAEFWFGDDGQNQSRPSAQETVIGPPDSGQETAATSESQTQMQTTETGGPRMQAPSEQPPVVITPTELPAETVTSPSDVPVADPAASQ